MGTGKAGRKRRKTKDSRLAQKGGQKGGLDVAVPAEKGTKASFFFRHPFSSRKFSGWNPSGLLNLVPSCRTVLSRGKISVP